MSYITATDLEARLGSTLFARLTDRVGGATANAAAAQQLAEEASALADSYLSIRYVVPVNLSTYPDAQALLVSRVLDVAEYMAWKQSPFVTDPPERVRFLYEDARGWFEGVLNGFVQVPAQVRETTAAQQQAYPLAQSTDRVFTHEELDGL